MFLIPSSRLPPKVPGLAWESGMAAGRMRKHIRQVELQLRWEVQYFRFQVHMLFIVMYFAAAGLDNVFFAVTYQFICEMHYISTAGNYRTC